jgi:hypothetical protein
MIWTDLCSTLDTMALAVSEQLHYGLIHPYFARCSSHCASGRPLSEAMTAASGFAGINFRSFLY